MTNRRSRNAITDDVKNIKNQRQIEAGKKEEKTHQRRITELRICEKVEVAVLDSPSLIARKVSVDVKLNSNTKDLSRTHEAAQ